MFIGSDPKVVCFWLPCQPKQGTPKKHKPVWPWYSPTQSEVGVTDAWPGGKAIQHVGPTLPKTQQAAGECALQTSSLEGFGRPVGVAQDWGTPKRSVSLSPNCCKFKKNQKGGFPVIFFGKANQQGVQAKVYPGVLWRPRHSSSFVRGICSQKPPSQVPNLRCNRVPVGFIPQDPPSQRVFLCFSRSSWFVRVSYPHLPASTRTPAHSQAPLDQRNSKQMPSRTNGTI